MHRPTQQTRGLVSAMVVNGVPQADIAAALKIDPKTLRKFYREFASIPAVPSPTPNAGTHFGIHYLNMDCGTQLQTSENNSSVNRLNKGFVDNRERTGV
jgi:hypothetical protein